ncbi:hypothetical protein [Thiorhodovibrio frisius]|uniref:Uncharacterized protein n=1 Tax=Thiorhodovibrio frisius TaxID=631362 RepID=H8YZ85_9GAMM|nr:hypothetical protein [Thiorhodovibrio frisius]EIC22012.1 hypothetical protein Thi970DRAFT_02253 [Thiorhodovibrio frisius]WPL24303.1 hypothetical protein Thiofri_04520 [Thiorhodovibrio frisius]
MLYRLFNSTRSSTAQIKPGITAALLGLALTGCSGGGLIAPETPQSNDFLNQLSANCGKLNIGNQPIDYLLNMDSNDTYFIDEASKLSAGTVDKATFASDINAFYPTGRNQAALECIFTQLGTSAP